MCISRNLLQRRDNPSLSGHERHISGNTMVYRGWMGQKKALEVISNDKDEAAINHEVDDGGPATLHESEFLLQG